MANVLKPKRTSTSGKIPTTTDIVAGEIALNMADAKLFYRDGNNTVKEITPTNATNATTATNIAGGSAGTIPYQTGAGTTAQLSAGTTGYFLKSNGTSAPSWANPAEFIGITNLSDVAITSPTTNQALVYNGTSWVNGAISATDSTKQPLNATLTSVSGLSTATTGLMKLTNGTASLDTNTYLTGNQSISVTGDATGSGTTSIAVTLANSGVTAGTYTKTTVDAKGRVTSGTTLSSADLPTYTGTITSSQITTGLGFTPYNSTNPSGYITSSGSITGNATTATSSTYHFVTDSRAVATTPQTIDRNVVFDFKQNATEGLSDGGTYFGEMTFRQYGSGTDWSGGLSHQLGFTDNGNIWQRSGSSTTWGSWKKLLDSSNYTSYSPSLTGSGASGTWGISVSGSSASCTGNSATATNVAWSGVTSKPTTLSGYGITDAAVQKATASAYGGAKMSLSGTTLTITTT